MNSFTDYYELLGVPDWAAPSEIKSAFKKLALQYHPDVYKGEDAHERMRILLLAYKTLNDPASREQYDIERRGHLRKKPLQQQAFQAHSVHTPYPGNRQPDSTDITPGARRDRQRYYAFPDFQTGQVTHFDLSTIDYTLSPLDGRTLVQHGLLRGMKPQVDKATYYCHRCTYRWPLPARAIPDLLPACCPRCSAPDWAELLLLRCVHCHAVFESEQIHYAIGGYNYGNSHSDLCPPYELFPLCPYCGKAHWAPAEEIRVSELRLKAERRSNLVRLLIYSSIFVAIIVFGGLLFGLLR
ncbi:J domain-containing protein [Tengunoibacter tsumagoiensis]|nr:J domain-containing protein [Tengunoibacter tsumagoiensis]